MSTQLPKALRSQIREQARDPISGLVRCAKCGGEFGDDEVQIDHIHPEHLGGGHEARNLQVLCYPKTGPSCHKQKSAEEAAARAAARERQARRPMALPLALFGLLLAATCGRAAWLLYTGQPLAPLVSTVQAAVRWWLVLTVGLTVAYVLAHLGLGSEAEKAKVTATGEPPEARITAALREEMGQAGTIRTKRIGQSIDRPVYRSSYAGTGFADHDDTSKFRVMMRLSAKMGGRWRCDWNTESDFVDSEKRPDLPAKVNHPGADPALPWHQIPIGPSTTLDLKVTPHALICGLTLAGKTSIFRSAIISLAQHAAAERVRLILFDPKQVELIGFRNWPGVREVLTEDAELYDAPGLIVDEMRRRMRLFSEQGVLLGSHTPWIVIVDEYREYVKRMSTWSIKEGRRKTVSSPLEPVENIATLLAMARKMNIHVIIGTQRPDAKWFGGDARDNCQFRAGVGPLSPTLARMLFNDGSQGRDIPAEAKGRFTAQQNDGGFVEDISYWVPDPTDADGTNTQADWDLLAELGMPTR